MWTKALSLTLAILALPAMSETRLIMAEEEGCVWCARWNEEIGPIYPKTPEGRAAPLLRLDLHDTSASRVAILPAACILRQPLCLWWMGLKPPESKVTRGKISFGACLGRC